MHKRVCDKRRSRTAQARRNDPSRHCEQDEEDAKTSRASYAERGDSQERKRDAGVRLVDLGADFLAQERSAKRKPLFGVDNGYLSRAGRALVATAVVRAIETMPKESP